MRVVINTDGSSRGNPGLAGIGVVIRAPEDNAPGGLALLAEISEPIGIATNNQAEYRALIRALEEALALGATEADVCCDSLLVVNQVNNKWRVTRGDLHGLCRQARDLKGRFVRCSINHAYNTQNLDADYLAKKASGTAVTRNVRGK